MLPNLLILMVLLGLSRCDTPANCTFDDIIGTWYFHEGPRGNTANIDCSKPQKFSHVSKFELNFPNEVVDEYGRLGTWTIIYNQGFEVSINNRKYFAFSNWTSMERHQVISRCHETKPGWSHDIFVRDWSCYYGRKGGPQVLKSHSHKLLENHSLRSIKFKTDYRMIKKINQKQKSWTAGQYADWEEMSLRDAYRKMGGPSSRVHKPIKAARTTNYHRQIVANLPSEFDWRNVKGENFVSAVRNQGGCGSCYSFASMGMLEARLKILTNNTQNLVFSPQDIVQCSEYSQGCSGGFPYLIGGKYAEDFGVVQEKDNPYSLPEPHEGVCKTKPGARRYYATNYRYVGGYYGGCNEALMRKALVENGPLAVGFEVYSDFQAYKGGVYHHTYHGPDFNRLNKWDPFQLTNHAVLVVGYGTDQASNEDYWIVKNSWGDGWGENGFFRIKRGNDECGIESMAVEATPIVTY